MTEPIQIKGLAEFNRALRRLDKDLPKGLRLAHNEAANVVVDAAKPEVPQRTGHAASTVKARSTRLQGRVTGGSKRYPYYAWLDFGGSVGRNKSIKREFVHEGRYIYPAYSDNYDRVKEVLVQSLIDLASTAGLEPSGG